MEVKVKRDAYKDCHYKKRQSYLETPINVDYHLTWKQCYSGKISEEISRGSYAAVYKARTVGNTRCAIKRPHKHILSFEKSVKNYKDEIKIHSTLDHPSIVSFYDIFSIDDNLPPLLIMERMWISLYSFIEQKLLGDFRLLLKLHILLDVAKGLSYLHSRNIIHRDVTLSNILLTKELNAKISDFGGAQQLDTTKCNYEKCSIPGNFLYMPPESFNSNPVCSPKLDVFSFGCNVLCTINETIPCHEDQFSKASVTESYLNNIPSDQPLLKELAENCLAHMPEHRPDIECVIKVLNTIEASICNTANNGQKIQMQCAPGVKKDDINIAQVASRKRLKALKEHGSSKALRHYEILATNGTILNFLKHNAPECGQHTNCSWLLNLATNFNLAITEVYLYHTYLEKCVFSSQPHFFQFSFIQSNISALFLNDVANSPTAAITAARATYFVAFSQSRTEVSFTSKQMITVSTPTERKASTVPKVFNVLLLKSSTDETYSHIPFDKRRYQEKHYFLQPLSATHHMGTLPCIQPHDLVQESLIEEPFTKRHEASILGNSTGYTKLLCSYSHMSSVAEESLSVSNTKINQCPDEAYSSCIDIAKVFFGISDSISVPHVHNMASANLPCNNAKPFECFGFTIALVVQRFGASYLFCCEFSWYARYCNNAWLIVAYQAIVNYAGKLFCTTGFVSAYFSADGVQKKCWFFHYAECTVHDTALSIDNVCTVGLVKTFALVDACKVLYLNTQHKPTYSNACRMSKLEFTKPKQSNIILGSLCAESVLCLQRGALFGQTLTKVVSDVESRLTSSHHISIKRHFICNQGQIESINFYARATQYDLQGNCIGSYVISQCSVSVANDEGSAGVLTLHLCQHKQLHTAILPRINCTLAGELSTTVVTKHYSTLTYSDIKKQQTTASFERYINSTSAQSYHSHYTYGKGYTSFYVCSTVQKQVVLSIQQYSLHLCFYYNMQLVLTLQCTCKHIYHQLCNDALCNGEAVLSNLWNGLVCSLGSYYFPRKHSANLTTNAQESVLDIPMLGMQDNLLSKDTTSYLNQVALPSSCRNDTTDMHFKWHCTLPAEAIQDFSNASRETMGEYGNSKNLPVSVAFDGKESSSQVTILKIKATRIIVNTTSEPLSKMISDVKSSLTSSHHISIKRYFAFNQGQIESINVYARATQYDLQGNCIGSYVISQCNVRVASDESSAGVLTLPLCQCNQLHTAILPCINCTCAGDLPTTVVTKYYNTLTYSDIKRQQTTASFKRYINSTSTQSYHSHYTYGKGYTSFYVCSTVQKQVVLSIQQYSLHLCFYYNMQLVLTLQCTCKHICHQLCNDALCNGEAVVNNLWNGLVCSLGSYCFPRKHSANSTTNAQESILDVPMLGMQNNLLSKDTTYYLNQVALASSYKNNTTDIHFQWHCTLPAEAIQDIGNASKEIMGQYGNSKNLPVSVAFNGKESNSQLTILKLKATQVNVNTASEPLRSNVIALNTENSVTEASRKDDVMKCTKKLDEWLFLHTVKGFICNSPFSLNSLLRFSPMLGKESLHKPISPTEPCKSCFNQPTLFRNLAVMLCCQVTLCTHRESTKANENFHHNINQYYNHASMLTLLLKLLQYEHRHLVTQCVQVNSSQHYNTYLIHVQTFALISATRSPDRLCIAYNCQIRESIIVEQFQVMQYKQYTSCHQEFHLDNNSMSATCKISQIQKKLGWLAVKSTMPELLHQSDDNLFNDAIQLEVHSCINDCTTKSVLCPSVDLQLGDVQASVLPKPSTTLHHLSTAISVDKYTCHLTKSFDNGSSHTIRDNVPRTTKAKQPLISSFQDEQLLNIAVTNITCSEQPLPLPRNACVVNKYLHCGPTMLLASTCMPHPSHGYENAAIQRTSDVPALTNGTQNHHDADNKQNNSNFVSYNQKEDKSCRTQQSKRSRCDRRREVRRHKTCNNRSDRYHDDDSHGKKHGFTPVQVIDSSLLVVLLVIILLLQYLIWLWLPGSRVLQHTTAKHSCNDVAFNSWRFNMYSKSMCQIITPGWTDNMCYHKSHSRPSFRVANGSTAIQVLPQDNLHFRKRQVSIANSKALASVSPQHGLCVHHKLQLMIIIKRKSHRMQTWNSGIVTSQCTAAAVSIIYEENLQQMPRMKRLISLLQHICTSLNKYSLQRKLYAFHFTNAKSRLQAYMLQPVNRICLVFVLGNKVVSCFYGENDATLHIHQPMKPIYIDKILNDFYTLQCSLFDETLNNPTFIHHLSKPCCFFRPNVLDTKQLCVICTMRNNRSHNNNNNNSKQYISNNKCKNDETEHEKKCNTHSSADNENNSFDKTHFLLMLVMLQLQVLYLVIIWYLCHTFGYCNDVVAFEIRSKEKRYLLSRVVLIDRMAYYIYPTVKLKSQFPSQVVLDYFHDRLYFRTHYKPLKAYSNHFLLQNLDINIAHCQGITSISADKRLYLISQGKGLILLQQWLINFLFILRGTIVMLTSYCAMNYQARNTVSKFHDVNSKMIYCIYTLQLMDSDVINRVLFARTHRYIFHIEGTSNIPKRSILEIHTPTIQWLSSFSRHDSRIPYQSTNDRIHFKRLLYSEKTLSHVVVTELPNEPAAISFCLQESVVDASESQNSVLHLTNTMKIVSTENRVDMLRPIGKLASGCTISYYSNQGTDDMDMFETWQLVIGNITFYHASGSQTLQNEHHHNAIINGNNINAIVNFGVEALQNIDTFMPPEKEVDLDDDFHHDNLMIVS